LGLGQVTAVFPSLSVPFGVAFALATTTPIAFVSFCVAVFVVPRSVHL